MAERRAWAAVARTIADPSGDAVICEERDQRLRRSADRAGDWVLTLIVIVCVGLLAGLPQQRLSWWLAPLIAANVLIGILILKSLTEHVCLVASYLRDRR